MSNVIQREVWAKRCLHCKSQFEYAHNDILALVGFVFDIEAVQCPVCKQVQPHPEKVTPVLDFEDEDEPGDPHALTGDTSTDEQEDPQAEPDDPETPDGDTPTLAPGTTESPDMIAADEEAAEAS